MDNNPTSTFVSFDTIDNLLLDLGGVLVSIDFMRMASAFEKLGIFGLEERYSHQQQIELFDHFDKGLISENDFRNELLRHFGLDHITAEQFDAAWNQIIVDVPETVLQCLEQLRQRFNLFLLSNTNSIHIRYLYRYLQEKRGIRSFEAFFKQVYYSFKMRSRKPEALIFKQVLVDSGIEADRTLFIDDTPANIETAKQLGFRVYLMPQGKLLPDVIHCD